MNPTKLLSYAVVDEQPIYYNFYERTLWRDWFAALHDKEDDQDPDNHMPIYNYLYPLPQEYEFNSDRERKALEPYALTIVHVADFCHYFLALTGCGMDMSWDICGAYVALGYYPPAHLCRLPEFAGLHLTPERRRIIDACHSSLTAQAEQNERRLEDLSQLEREIAGKREAA